MASVGYIAPLAQIQPPKALTSGSFSGTIGLADFLAAVRDAESAYAQLTPTEIISSIRQLYYGTTPFQLLLPASVGAEQKYGYYPFPVLLKPKSIAILRARADENGSRDNPSPYLMPSSQPNAAVDIGHQVLTIDALLHPRADDPFLAYKIPNIDPASWIADLAIAAYWNEVFTSGGIAALYQNAEFITLTGADDPDALRKRIKAAGSLTLDDFYEWSAPETDLLGDIDGYCLYDLHSKDQKLPFSALLESYYATTTPVVKKRFSIFCLATRINYDHSTKDWHNADVIRGQWTPRIDRCVDFFLSSIWAMLKTTYIATPPPPPKSYPSSNLVLGKFLTWLKARLQAELRILHGDALPSSGYLFPP